MTICFASMRAPDERTCRQSHGVTNATSSPFCARRVCGSSVSPGK
jgi:hypothetical protein